MSTTNGMSGTRGIRIAGLVATLAIIAAACSSSATTPAPATTTPATEAPATEAPATEAPATEAPATEAPATEAPSADTGPVNPYVETGAVPGSGVGRKIGYISLGEQCPS